MGCGASRVTPSGRVNGREQDSSMVQQQQTQAVESTDGDSQLLFDSTYYSRQESSNSSSRTFTRGGGGGVSRPDSQKSRRPISRISHYSGKVGLSQGRNNRGTRPESNGSLYGRNDTRLGESFHPKRLDFDLMSSSFRSRFANHRQQSVPDPNPCEQSSLDEGTSYLMKLNRGSDEAQSHATLCPCCNSRFSGIVHIPYLLLCGHSYCSTCLDQALKHDPRSLKCGICHICTPVDPQSRAEDFMKNEAILDLIDSKEFTTVISSFQIDRCAECERSAAVMYCSDCAASYCEPCNRQQHTGSKVRAKHKPVSINLKPRPQPTCKKHHGQTCVLYCETERQPMCVLCKFYGQHKFHNCKLLNNSAADYRSMLSMKLSEVNKMEERLAEVAQQQGNMKSEIREKAMDAQTKLERHFSDTRNELLAALEHREATLLSLLDRQVEVREMMLEEQRMELASARSRVIAAKEEVTKLLDLNPISALFARKHADSSLDSALKLSTVFPHLDDDSKTSNVQLLPVGLRPKQELTSKLQQVLNQHGVVLQLPEKAIFVEVKIHSKSISLHWELPEQSMEVTTDRTRMFSLHCFADVPFKFKKDKIQNLNRRFQGIQSGVSYDSGFVEGSTSSDGMSQTSDVRLPLLPPSMRTNSNHNVSLVMQQNTPDLNATDYATGSDTPPAVQAANKGTALKPQSVKLVQSTAAARASGALLKLPALLTKTTEEDTAAGGDSPDADSETDVRLDSNMSERLSDLEDVSKQTNLTVPVIHKGVSDTQTSSTSSSSNSTESVADGVTPVSPDNSGVNVGPCCKGYPFEEIYSGHDSRFSYSGIVAGATYYFRVRCCNAIGEGPWSDTHKCKIPPPASGLV